VQNNEPAKERESEKIAIVCPLTMSLIGGQCLVKTCMWNSEGNCIYKPEASELDLGEGKGLSISKCLLETRKAKANITRILILDKYVSWTVEKYPEKSKYSRRLLKNSFVLEAKEASKLNNEAFNVSLYHFCLLCRGRVFKKFIENFPDLKRNKLPSILGIRENTISKVNRQYKKVSTRKSKSKSTNTNQ